MGLHQVAYHTLPSDSFPAAGLQLYLAADSHQQSHGGAHQRGGVQEIEGLQECVGAQFSNAQGAPALKQKDEDVVYVR